MAGNDVVRFGLVGCGKIARKHVAALRSLPGARIVGVCDADPARAKALGAELGVPGVATVEALAGECGPQVVNVLTPSGAHFEAAMATAAAGLHVVVEKPLVLRSDQGRDLVARCAERGTGLFVVNQNRQNLPVAALRRALDAGRFGKPVMGSVRLRWRRTQEYYDEASWRGTWRLDGGVLANQALHHIDMLLWMMGEVESVSCRMATRLVKVEVEDTAVATLRFRSGALGVIEATTATRPRDLEGAVTVLGEKGSVEIGGFAMDDLRVWQFDTETPEDEAVRRDASRNPKEFAWNHARYLETVVERVRGGKADRAEGEEACRVVELLDALYDSAAAGTEAVPGVPLGRSRLGRG